MRLNILYGSALLLVPVASALETTVDLGYTHYRGRELSNGIVQWLGMRYAAPPLGKLRFAAPEDPVAAKGVQEANKHGSICIPTGKYSVTSKKISEDCLFIDVFAPKGASRLPVFFWIQGGGFNVNSNANYNGTGLIKASDMGIVVVTFNYRVGPYGFLAGEEVVKGGSLNNGLKDQVKALKWVQKHISKFGGDPKHVVIGGDSAGAASITLLLSAHGGRDDGLFHAAAAESQSFGGMLTVKESQFAYDNLVKRTGCGKDADTLACLRKLDIDTLQKQNFNTPLPGAQKPPLYMYGPTIDDDLVPDYTYRLFHQGKFIKVPVIFGDDTNEGTIFVPKHVADVAEADTFLQSQFPKLTPDHLKKINELYLKENQTRPFPNATSWWRPASNAYGELRYICPGIDMSAVYEKAGVKSWNYHYAVDDKEARTSGVGVFHTVECNAIWGPPYVNGGAPKSYSTTNAPIVPVMQGYWTSFIKTFDPNTHRARDSPEWKTWGDKGGYSRIFIKTHQTKMEQVPADQRERCKYLTGIGVALGQ
ncbi:putative triacylglycerol lipase [Aspergillus clavatus NRRL 1]|uniref:Carboxylic ester hydrolase n=1 Tax=Aspergillus clavatus (strain ATCC 1007 / CBS 513.65 / DSM 816 / NCTC 3887 / NRRL 1 / QM 1276 / 107) TaxID=344612 RepID=A1C3W0_ASPCL|nr:triacylglycerol lipase, putative [Aspergillus clavatus NRRL 1]EAW15100.1 triacylglycerol lipase, putative [Aspergillus clavatus NRRL 1]